MYLFQCILNIKSQLQHYVRSTAAKCLEHLTVRGMLSVTYGYLIGVTEDGDFSE